jgi:iron complex outermembrane receptor protein
MGGAINLVTMKPSRPLEAEGSLSTGGRGLEGWNAHAIVGSRRDRYYVQGSLALSDRDSWSLPGSYAPASGSLQRAGERLGSDTRDWRVNVKLGFTPNATNEYTINQPRSTSTTTRRCRRTATGAGRTGTSRTRPF